MAQATPPRYTLRVEPDPSDPDDPSGFELLNCPACSSVWISSAQPSIYDDGTTAFTAIPLSCAECAHRWELRLSDRKGQVAITYGPGEM